MCRAVHGREAHLRDGQLAARSAGEPQKCSCSGTVEVGDNSLFCSYLLKALSVALDPDGGAQVEVDGQLSGKGNAESSFAADDRPADTADHYGTRADGAGAQPVLETDDTAAAGPIGFERPGSLRAVFSSQGGEADGPGAAAVEAALADWDDFMQRTLHGILDHQMVGSYTNIANLSAMSQVRNDSTYLGPLRKLSCISLAKYVTRMTP